jgi:hypothetical protein
MQLASASFAEPVLRSEPAIVRAVETQSAKGTLTTLASRLRPVSVIVRAALLFEASSSVRESTLPRQKALVSLTRRPMAMASSRPVSMKLAFRNLEKLWSLSQQPLQIFSTAHSKAESLPISFCHEFSWQLRDRR